MYKTGGVIAIRIPWSAHALWIIRWQVKDSSQMRDGGGVSEHTNSPGPAVDPLCSWEKLTEFHHEQGVIVHDRTRENEAVYSVEDTSVARHQAAGVLCSRPALEQGF